MKLFLEVMRLLRLDAMMITSPANRAFLLHMPADETGLAVLTQAGRLYYLTDRCSHVRSFDLSGEVKIQFVNVQSGYLSLLRGIIAAEQIAALGYEEMDLRSGVLDTYRRRLSCRLVPTAQAMEGLRSIKTSEEVEWLRTAGAIAQRAFEASLSFLRPGITEMEVARRLQCALLEGGAQGIPFLPMVAFGSNSSAPHHSPGERTLRVRDTILMDFGCQYRGYCSDICRTVVLGEADEEVIAAYDAAYEALQQCAKLIHPGTATISVTRLCRKLLYRRGYCLPLDCGIGHGIGLEVHEAPFLDCASAETFHPGMVFTLEPGVYRAGEFGLRIEDMFLLEGVAAVALTAAPERIIVL